MRALLLVLVWLTCGLAAAEDLPPPQGADSMRQLSTSHPREFIARVRKALDANAYADDPGGEREALWWMGRAAIAGSDDAALTEAISRLNSLAGVEHDTLAQSFAGFLAADHRLALGDTGGIDDALRAAALQLDSSNPAHRALAKFQLCDVYSMASQPHHSQPLCREADTAFAALHDGWNRAQAENVEGNNELFMGNLPAARRYYQRARSRYRAAGDEAQALMVGDNLAQVYLKQGKPQQAIVLSRASLANERAAGRQSDALISQYDIARALQAMGRRAEAMKLTESTLQEARKAKLMVMLPDLLEEQSQLAEQDGKLKLALSAEREALAATRTQMARKLSSQQAQLAARYAAREKEIRIQQLERNNQIKTLKLQAAQALSARNASRLQRQRGMLLAALVAAAGLLVGFVSLLLLLHAQRRHARELRRQALEDPLTSVENRRGFFTRAHALLDRRDAGHAPLHALLLFDFDHFKQINDRHGHPFGDVVLSVSLQRLRAVIGERGHLARLGGEEFIALCPHLGAEAARVLAEDMRSAVRKLHFAQAPEGVEVTISMGVALFDGVRCHDVDSWLREADDAMYTAKLQGRDQIVVAPGSDGR